VAFCYRGLHASGVRSLLRRARLGRRQRSTSPGLPPGLSFPIVLLASRLSAEGPTGSSCHVVSRPLVTPLVAGFVPRGIEHNRSHSRVVEGWHVRCFWHDGYPRPSMEDSFRADKKKEQAMGSKGQAMAGREGT
jgi:hypothetical protein